MAMRTISAPCLISCSRSMCLYTAQKLTIALIEHKLEEHRLLKNTKRKVMKHGQSVNLGCFRVEFVKTNHSIQDASALAIFKPTSGEPCCTQETLRLTTRRCLGIRLTCSALRSWARRACWP